MRAAAGKTSEYLCLSFHYLLRTFPSAMFGKAATGVSFGASAPLSALKGKNVLVVGGTGGVGRALAKAAAAAGGDVVVAGRSYRDAGVPNISFVSTDASSMKSSSKLGASIEPIPDIVIFTTGTCTGAKRVETSEGIEEDMAISALSRIATLNTLLPRLKPGARVFIWGMPGNGHSEKGSETNLSDLNAVHYKWVSGFNAQHLNTVAVNEALVLHLAAQPDYKGKVSFFGCNPGLIAHSALRDKVHGGGFFGSLIEGAMSFFTQSAEQYAKRMWPVMLAPGLDAVSGSLIGPSATPILRAPIFNDASKVNEVIADAQALITPCLK